MRKRTPIKLEISACFSVDIENVETWTPDGVHYDNVYYNLYIDIGVQGERGTNSFRAIIATPEGLRWRGHPGHGAIVFQDYSWSAVKETLEVILEECTKNTWGESVDCLRHHFHWEYEGMA